MIKVKKFKAESFDIMQYFYGAVHEPLIHCLIEFFGHVDEKALKKAVTISAQALPMIQCCFNYRSRKPYWEYKGFRGEDMVQLINQEGNTEDYRNKLLGATIDISSQPQLKIIVSREKVSDTLCIIINHMICDGGGFKEYLYLLSNLYKSCKEEKRMIPLKKH